MTNFSIKVEINLDLMKRIKTLIPDVKREFKVLLRTEVVDFIEKRMNELMMTDRPAPSRPFKFASKESQAYYFAAIVPVLNSSSGSYQRTGEVEQGFRAEATNLTSLRDNQLGLFRMWNATTNPLGEPLNPMAASRYQPVITPMAVAGHQNTGWPAFTQANAEKVKDEAIDRIERLWSNKAIESAMRSRK